MDIGAPVEGDYRPGLDVLLPLQRSCRVLLHDRAAFDDAFLASLRELLPAGHPLHEAPAFALDLLDVILRAVLSGEGPEHAEAESRVCGERCAAVGLPDDSYAAVGRAVARAARERSGDAWSSSMSSGWAAMHLWLVGNFAAGAALARSRGLPDDAWPPEAPGDGPVDGAVAGSGDREVKAPVRDAVGGPVGGPGDVPGDGSGDVSGGSGRGEGEDPDEAGSPDGHGRDRRSLRGRKPKSTAARPPDWSNVWGDSKGISNWAFDRADRSRRPGGDSKP